MPVSSPGSSTLQWGSWRGWLWLGTTNCYKIILLPLVTIESRMAILSLQVCHISVAFYFYSSPMHCNCYLCMLLSYYLLFYFAILATTPLHAYLLTVIKRFSSSATVGLSPSFLFTAISYPPGIAIKSRLIANDRVTWRNTVHNKGCRSARTSSSWQRL